MWQTNICFYCYNASSDYLPFRWALSELDMILIKNDTDSLMLSVWLATY